MTSHFSWQSQCNIFAAIQVSPQPDMLHACSYNGYHDRPWIRHRTAYIVPQTGSHAQAAVMVMLARAASRLSATILIITLTMQSCKARYPLQHTAPGVGLQSEQRSSEKSSDQGSEGWISISNTMQDTDYGRAVAAHCRYSE